jgi:hypothetical protein
LIIQRLGSTGIFIIIIFIIIAIIVDTSIVSIATSAGGLRSSVSDIALFIFVVIVFAVGQYVILAFVKQLYKDKEDRIGGLKQHSLDLIDKAVTITQYALVAILVFTILQMLFMSSYHILILKATIFISYSLSFILLALLAKRFFSWFKLNHNLVVLAYALATTMISINAIITIIYINNEFINDPAIIRPIRSLTGALVSPDITLSSFYVISSVLSFILTWIATAMLHNSSVCMWRCFLKLFSGNKCVI